MRRILMFAAVSLAVGSGVRAEIVDIRWTPDGRYTHEATVPAGKFVEVCGKLRAGMKVQWEFDASAPMDFNVHYHVGKDVTYPTKLSAVAAAKDLLEIKIEQDL